MGIKEGKTYDGKQIDMFSTGVILFIIVQGIFPFKEAKKDEYFYNLILSGNLDTYWKKTGAGELSPEFKDLIIKMFSYNGNERPTIAQIREHPWMSGEKPNTEKIRSDIIEELASVRSASTNETMRDDTNCRGDDYKGMIRPVPVEDLSLNNKHANCNEFDIDVAPGVIFESLAAAAVELEEELNCKINVAVQEKNGGPRNILITAEPKEAKEDNLEAVASVETENGEF